MKTAIEWLEEEIYKRYKFTFQQLNCSPLEEAIQEAKEKEREQIEIAYQEGYYYNKPLTKEEYYETTFKK